MDITSWSRVQVRATEAASLPSSLASIRARKDGSLAAAAAITAQRTTTSGRQHEHGRREAGSTVAPNVVASTNPAAKLAGVERYAPYADHSLGRPSLRDCGPSPHIRAARRRKVAPTALNPHHSGACRATSTNGRALPPIVYGSGAPDGSAVEQSDVSGSRRLATVIIVIARDARVTQD